ncbi:pentatricopeptide repeat superfamily isoform A [Chlorella sorokiniana]|uniref:Pentatricopeptide repeat superfamily isoform A n=1 Tax=Chlorella sorokiniana TaxID=3076 RepID=A0A2P6TS07_CHLSO|nr:pentatricopeptide repeat superfamily isoform A [Chlorella sorokiniana]|eukprot:PRW56853.1 pentatricopeptide repeat superfamily isoform A [Chlorella sorokiniana]
MQASRRLHKLLPLLAARGGGAAAGSAGVLLEPIPAAGARYLSSRYGHADGDADRPAEGRRHRDGGGERRHGGGRRFPRMHGWEAPIDTPRTLQDYEKLVLGLARRRRAYLIRDVLDEMLLNGMRPNRFILSTGLFYCMKTRKLGDAMFFFEEMKRRGIAPDAAAYSNAISACGRAGYLGKAVELKDEMLAAGLPMTHNIRLALLHSFAESGSIKGTREWFDEIVASGRPADEFAFAGLANCYRHIAPRAVPKDAEQQLLEVLQQFKEARVAWDAQRAAAAASEGQHEEEHGGLELEEGEEQQDGAPTKDGRPFSPQLVVHNAVLNSLVELGRHEAAKALFASMAAQGPAPDHTSYANIVRSHLNQAVGRHHQPQGAQLTALLNQRVKGADLSADYAAVLEEEPHLKAALEATEAAEAARGGAAQPAAAQVEQAAEEEEEVAAVAGGSSAELAGGEDEEAYVGPPLEDEASSSDSSSSSSDSDSESSDEEAAAAASAASKAAAGGERRRTQRGGREGAPTPASFKGMSAAELRAYVRSRSTHRARSRLRFVIFKEHTDVDAWYEALHLFQEVLDRGMQWGPDITFSMVKAALDMQATGLEDSLAVAHAVLDHFERQGLFIGVEQGTELLQLAVRRDVGDLSVAHRIYDRMATVQRIPKTAAIFKYMRAVAQREPHAHERLMALCSRILSDPDRSNKVAAMKSEAFKRKQLLVNELQQEKSGEQ